jgi:hypothetical protein
MWWFVDGLVVAGQNHIPLSLTWFGRRWSESQTFSFAHHLSDAFIALIIARPCLDSPITNRIPSSLVRFFF